MQKLNELKKNNNIKKTSLFKVFMGHITHGPFPTAVI